MAVDTSGVAFRRVRDGDLPALLALFEAAFDGWPGIDLSVPPVDHLRWKLDAFPGDTYHYVAELDGRIVAGQWNQFWSIRAGGRLWRVCRGGDSAVHPDYQGRGVMTGLRAHMLADMPRAGFLFGVSTHPAVAAIYAKEPRRSFAHRWWALRYPFSLREAVAAFKLRPGRSIPKLARSLRDFTRWRRTGGAPAPRSCTLRTADAFDERIDAFSRDACAPFDFAIVRSRDVLNWRYADPRAGRFIIRLAEDGDRLLGYAVLRATGGAGYVADLLALPGRLDVVDSLARDAAALLRETGVAAAECWLMADHPYVPVVRAAGFLGRRVHDAPTYEPFAVPESDLAFLTARDASVHLTIGDMDIV